MSLSSKLIGLLEAKSQAEARLATINADIAAVSKVIDGAQVAEAPAAPPVIQKAATKAKAAKGKPAKAATKAPAKKKSAGMPKPNRKTVVQIDAIKAAGGSVNAGDYAKLQGVDEKVALRRLRRFEAMGLLTKGGGDSFSVAGVAAPTAEAA